MGNVGKSCVPGEGKCGSVCIKVGCVVNGVVQSVVAVVGEGWYRWW